MSRCIWLLRLVVCCGFLMTYVEADVTFINKTGRDLKIDLVSAAAPDELVGDSLFLPSTGALNVSFSLVILASHCWIDASLPEVDAPEDAAAVLKRKLFRISLARVRDNMHYALCLHKCSSWVIEHEYGLFTKRCPRPRQWLITLEKELDIVLSEEPVSVILPEDDNIDDGGGPSLSSPIDSAGTLNWSELSSADPADSLNWDESAPIDSHENPAEAARKFIEEIWGPDYVL